MIAKDWDSRIAGFAEPDLNQPSAVLRALIASLRTFSHSLPARLRQWNGRMQVDALDDHLRADIGLPPRQAAVNLPRSWVA